jgi:hypothetical protein
MEMGRCSSNIQSSQAQDTNNGPLFLAAQFQRLNDRNWKQENGKIQKYVEACHDDQEELMIDKGLEFCGRVETWNICPPTINWDRRENVCLFA